MTFKTEKISTGMPLQGFRRLKSGNPHEYWAEACKRDDFQWITVELGLPAYASDGQFYQRGQEGWFWYQVIPEPKQPDELTKPEFGAEESSQSELKPFSAAWFREHMRKRSFRDVLPRR